MSRFAVATLVAAAIVIGALALTHGAARWEIVGATVAAYIVLTGCGVAFVRMRYFADAFCRGKPGAMRLALTFDDGPDPASTPAALDALQRLGVRATFFCVGERAKVHPELLQRMARDGHEIGNHSFRHAWWTNFLFSRGLFSEVKRTQEAIAGAAGVSPRWFRAPMGLSNPHMPSALRQAGVTLAGWHVGGRDRAGDADAVGERILRGVRDGSIILLHDGGADAARLVRIFEKIVSACRARGYTFVTVSELAQQNRTEGRA